MEIGDLNIPWTESPFFERLLAQSDLDEPTRGMVRAFANDGFLKFDPEIPDFDAVAAEIVRDCAKRPDYPQRAPDAWAQIEGVRRLAMAPRVLSVLRALYRREPIPMQTLNFGRGTEQRAHSDAMHFSSVPAGFMCGVWIALEDIDEDNGPLMYYPGSHRLRPLDHAAIGVTGSEQKGYEHYGTYEELVEMVVRELGLERRELKVPKGRALVWAANLLHGGSKVRDPSRTRHSQVTHYYFEGCLYYHRSLPRPGRVARQARRAHRETHSPDLQRPRGPCAPHPGAEARVARAPGRSRPAAPRVPAGRCTAPRPGPRRLARPQPRLRPCPLSCSSLPPSVAEEGG